MSVGDGQELAALISAYADGRLDRHQFIDTVAEADLSPAIRPGFPTGDIELPAAGTMADIDRAYISGLIDDETYRDIYVARRLREAEPGREH